MDKKEYIVNNISKINHLKIINLIKKQNTEYTENKNGIFINLNSLDDNIIHGIYNIIYYDINHNLNKIKDIDDINNIDDLKELYINPVKTKDKFIHKLKKDVNKEIDDICLLKNYSMMDKDIIIYSKQYNLS
jgi:hypothetical protein